MAITPGEAITEVLSRGGAIKSLALDKLIIRAIGSGFTHQSIIEALQALRKAGTIKIEDGRASLAQ